MHWKMASIDDFIFTIKMRIFGVLQKSYFDNAKAWKTKVNIGKAEVRKSQYRIYSVFIESCDKQKPVFCYANEQIMIIATAIHRCDRTLEKGKITLPGVGLVVKSDLQFGLIRT